MNKVIKQILLLRKAGKVREADKWLNHPKISKQARFILLNCLNEFNAGKKFEIGSKLPAPITRKITKHDVSVSMKGWSYNGRFCRRIAAIVFGEKFVQEMKLRDTERYKNEKHSYLDFGS